MPILFADLLQPKLDVHRGAEGTWWQQLVRQVETYDACPLDWPRSMDSTTIRRCRQLDKYEPAITAYVLAALSLASDGFQDERVIGPLMRRAFSDPDTAQALVEHLGRPGSDGLHCPAPRTGARDAQPPAAARPPGEAEGAPLARAETA